METYHCTKPRRSDAVCKTEPVQRLDDVGDGGGRRQEAWSESLWLTRPDILQTRPYRGKILVIPTASQSAFSVHSSYSPARANSVGLRPFIRCHHCLLPRHGEMVCVNPASHPALCSASIDSTGHSSTTMKCFGTKSKTWCEHRVLSSHCSCITLTHDHPTGRAP